MNVSYDCSLKQLISNTDEECMRIAMTLPSTRGMVRGVIVKDENNSFDDDDLYVVDIYGNTVCLSGEEDIKALMGFAAYYLELLKQRNCSLEDKLPEDAKVGALSEEELKSLDTIPTAAQDVMHKEILTRARPTGDDGEIVL